MIKLTTKELSLLRVACLLAAKEARARAEDVKDKELVGIYMEQAAIYDDLYSKLWRREGKK